MSYYLEDHPNLPGRPAQYGWPRTRVSGVIGVHTTESGVVFSGADPGAENTARFISTRSDHGSYHIMADWDTIVPLTRPTFAAWADTTNNVHALSVSGAMNAARWRDLTPERAAGIVRNMGIAAAMLVRDAMAHGVLDEVVPARRITAQQAIDGTAKGFYGHGETNPGTRYDPGTNFDWDLFLATYAAAVGGTMNYQSIITELKELGMDADQEERVIAAINDAGDRVINDLRAHIAQVPGRTLNATIARGGEMGGETSLGSLVSWNDQHVIQTIAAASAAAAGDGATVEQITEAVKQAISESVVKVDVSVEGGK